MLADRLSCAHYHVGDIIQAERLEQWLIGGGLILATSVLGTGVDFPGIVCILLLKMLWGMIHHEQESGQGRRAGERVDSVVAVGRGKVERTMKQKSDDLDLQAMGTLLVGSGGQ